MTNRKITVESLAADERFQQWVRAPRPDLDQYWQTWIKERPEHTNTVLQARQLIESLESQDNIAPSGLKQQVWEQVRASMEANSDNRSIPFFSYPYRRWIAASLVLFLLASVILLYNYWNATESYQTAYGETKAISLPDGSTVILNANSSLWFTSRWDHGNRREVWLEGEAFFEVKQIPISTDNSMSQSFVVHSQNMEVEVLGTTFNVKDRDQYSEIVLNTGRVSVTPQQEQQVPPIAMQPGERLSYSSDKHEWEIQQVEAEKITAWRYQELIFDEMKLVDLARLLEEIYGYDITFENEEIKTYSFTGNIKSDEIELLFPMLKQSFQMKIQQDGKKIRFSKR